VSHLQGGRNRHIVGGMVTPQDNGMARVTVTLLPEDVQMLDRMAAIQGTSRSAELRDIIDAARPVYTGIIAAFESAIAQKSRMDQAIMAATEGDLVRIAPELEKIQETFLGVMSRLEGAAAAADAPASNTGATNS